MSGFSVRLLVCQSRNSRSIIEGSMVEFKMPVVVSQFMWVPLTWFTQSAANILIAHAVLKFAVQGRRSGGEAQTC